MQLPSKKIFFADHVFHVMENVYEPAEDSFLFAENMSVREGDRVIDMGTGCGILGIIAATEASEVVAIDLNPYAVLCAKENAKLNHVAHKMLFVQGDLFSPMRLGEEFDLILFNAPYLPSHEFEGHSWIELAWDGGFAGREVLDRFISGAPTVLSGEGRVLLMQSTLSNIDETLKKLQRQNFDVEVTARRHLPFFESIALILAERK
jgi:release factor glutamine methyltransferase